MSTVHSPTVLLNGGGPSPPTTTYNVNHNNYNRHHHHGPRHVVVEYDVDDEDDNIMLMDNNSPMMMTMNPIRMEKYRQRMEAARSFLQKATETSNIVHAEKIINEACELLESWTMDYDEEVVHGSAAAVAADGSEAIENPFATFLAQARHRLGQIALLKGDLQSASTLFLHVILHDSHTLSPSALAMTWYDVALIFMRYGNTPQAEESLKQAYASLMNQETRQVNHDDTLFLFIQQAMIRLVDSVARNIPASIVGLPFSSQFTVVTYNFRNADNEEADADVADRQGDLDSGSTTPTFPSKSNIQEESRRLLDPSIWAAGAA